MNETGAEFSVLSVPKAGSGSPVEEFARIVANMNRLLSRIPNIPVFKQAELGVAEWIALTVLHRAGQVNNNQLAIKLGVTRQRAHQLINKLESAKLISVQVSPRDSRQNIISLSKNGERHLEKLNTEILSYLDAALGPQMENLGRLRKQLLQLNKSLRFAEQNASKKPERAAAKKTEPAGTLQTATQSNRMLGYLGWKQPPQDGGE